MSLLNGQKNTSHEGADHEKEHMTSHDSISFYPMAFPMVVGPGTIATIIILSQQAHDSGQYIVYGIAAGSVLVLMLVVLFFASAIGHVLSDQMRVIITRVMGMVLGAISVEMAVSVLEKLLPGLAAG